MHGRRRLSHYQTGAMLIASALLFAGPALAQPTPGKKPVRPAATAPTPEEQFEKQLPPPAKPEEIEAQAKIPVEQHCMKNPKCRQKLEMIKQGKRPGLTLPAAAAPSPEEQFEKSLPPPALGPQGRVPGSVERFFSWINPFAPETAMALTLSTTTTAKGLTAETTQGIKFTPGYRYSSSPYGYIGLYGVYAGSNLGYFGLFNNSSSTSYSWVENKPYVMLVTKIDQAGYYLIDIEASYSILKLRHQSGGPILEIWDLSKGCGSTVCHYQTVDYYAAGSQYWYLWADPKVWGAYFYSITIKPGAAPTTSLSPSGSSLSIYP